MTIALKFCGGARTVTGSMHLLFTDFSKILLDCGLFHGSRDEYYAVNSHFAFNPQDVDGVIASHAHIDHCGNIPTLIKQGFRSSVYCTPTTRDLCRYMLPDSGFVQEEDIKYVNKINKRRGIPPREPLYNQKDAEKAIKYFRAVDYHTPFNMTKDITLTFYESGHILGSAITVIEVKTRKKNVRIAYAVDLGRDNLPLLKSPEVPSNVDYIIIESTYGNREHESIEEAETKLTDAINYAVKRGGKVIIPAFALERTQLIVHIISELMRKNKIRKVPIYVDGPLAVNVTKVFREHPEYFDAETRKAFLDKDDPLAYDNINYVKNVNDSKRVNEITRPCIIISASGMCENGRILHHLKNNIENPNNTIIIIGYMAENTLGRRIVEKEQSVRIFGRPYDLRAEVVIINAFSAHADKHALVDYVYQSRDTLKGVFIVHGETEQSETLRANIRKKMNNIKPRIPARDEVVYLSGRD